MKTIKRKIHIINDKKIDKKIDKHIWAKPYKINMQNDLHTTCFMKKYLHSMGTSKMIIITFITKKYAFQWSNNVDHKS